ncbi:MAG: ubiquinone biosynthesis accessory factor UbiJ [bacterium]
MSAAENVLFDTLNRAVHAVLSVDPDTARAFEALDGKVYCIKMTLPPVTLYLRVEPEGFSLAPVSEQQADVTLEGSIFAFARMGGKGTVSKVMTDGQIRMEGDAEAGQALQKILGQFDFDWEELIARLVGDMPARKVGNLMRAASEWAGNSATVSRENLADYLTEEKRVIVSQLAMDRFSREVNQLRADTDRLAIRIDRLQQKR